MAEEFHNNIEQAILGREVHQQAADYHSGDKVRQVGDGLDRPLKRFVPHFIQQQCKDNRNRKPNDQGQQADLQGILDQTSKIDTLEKLQEIFESHKGAAPDSLCELVVPKRYLDSVEWDVMEYRIPQHYRQCKA